MQHALQGEFSDTFDYSDLDGASARRFSSRPLVTLDWGWVRAMRRPVLLHRSFTYLIPDVTFHEVIGSSDPEAHSVRLRDLFYSNPGQVFIGKHWNHLADRELNAGQLISPAELALSDTSKVGKRRRLSAREWVERAKQLGEDDAEHARVKESFERLRAEFVELWRTKGGDFARRCAGNLDEYKKAIREESIVADWLKDLTGPYGSQDWRQALAVFPDKHAIGRIVRIWLWQMMRPTRISNTERLRNDAEDCSYMLLASYSNEVWTCDKDLALAVSVLFPNTRAVVCPTDRVRHFSPVAR